MQSIGGDVTEELDFGKLWQAIHAVTKRHTIRFSIIAALAFFLPLQISGLLFPTLTDLAAKGRPPAPPGFWPFLVLNILVYLIGWTSIVAVAADPDESEGMPVAAIVRSALPAIGKEVVAGLIFVACALVAALSIAIMVGLIAFVVTVIASGGLGTDDNGRALNLTVGVFMIALMAPLLIWATARLLPTTGVFLREKVGIFEGMERAWALSDGAAWPIIKFGLVFVAISFGFSLLTAGQRWFGLTDGTGRFVAGLAMGGLSAAVAMVQAVGTGVVYRQLVAQTGSS
jgi:hypothetical protein